MTWGHPVNSHYSKRSRKSNANAVPLIGTTASVHGEGQIANFRDKPRPLTFLLSSEFSSRTEANKSCIESHGDSRSQSILRPRLPPTQSNKCSRATPRNTELEHQMDALVSDLDDDDILLGHEIYEPCFHLRSKSQVSIRSGCVTNDYSSCYRCRQPATLSQGCRHPRYRGLLPHRLVSGSDLFDASSHGKSVIGSVKHT
ncbi:hypothetical protein BKA70DRAFT_58999 [Coprinopsis sp. MPI-PUGE-AT-0042]|nr:hypothetical protein BKA70DRAFT_58999 [Coprinopsis sp. MPI-PUGE-AT-0042]